MGNKMVLNDTLQLTPREGFPDEIIIGQEYTFRKDGLRLYRLPPVRVFLALNEKGKWDYQGEAHVTELTFLPLEEKTVEEDMKATLSIFLDTLYNPTDRAPVDF